MAAASGAEQPPDEADDGEDRLRAIEGAGRSLAPPVAAAVGLICAVWSLFQLWLASPFPFMFGFGIITSVPARGIHLALGLLLCFLIYPAARRIGTGRIPLYDAALAVTGAACAGYLFFGYEGLVRRQGVLLVEEVSAFGAAVAVPVEAIIGGIGIVVLLEATRRAVGLPLVIVCAVFLLYSVFGQSMPELISHKGVSLNRLIGYQWMGGEAIFGIPLDVSVSFVFLFVLFGALLDRAGAGRYFLDLAFALVGRYRGGPAKAAIMASGMTGLISGSSIANVVTTGTFTIPVMVRTGLPAVKAGAIEVAASTNGQMMPPIMGAAAFIIAEFIGISYFDVIVAAFIPALISYMALFYISHLESLKLGLSGMPRADLPRLGRTFIGGVHYLIPILVLVYLLIVERWTPSSAVFYSIACLMAIVLAQHVIGQWRRRDEGGSLARGLRNGIADVYAGLVAGARNMVGVAVAIAAAGIIVGAVSSTGLNNALVGVIEAIAGGNVYLLLLLTALLCIVLGMGLPTTANYLVVASLLAGVLVELGNAAGLALPLIAVHLFVFFFGLLADSTPPVCLAAFAASAISRADPLKTGVQAFLYDIRTAILPFVFIFNPELLLIGVTSVWHGLLVFAVSLLAILCFSSLTQRWMFERLRWYEAVLLLGAMIGFFRPDYVMDQVHPTFAAVDIGRIVSGESRLEPGRTVRVHVVRETPYGDRFKLFRLPPAEDPSLAGYGLELDPPEAGRYPVANVPFRSPAAKLGIRPYEDYVTGIEVEQPGRPAKEWVYPLALLLLALAVTSQLVRRRAS